MKMHFENKPLNLRLCLGVITLSLLVTVIGSFSAISAIRTLSAALLPSTMNAQNYDNYLAASTSSPPAPKTVFICATSATPPTTAVPLMHSSTAIPVPPL